MNLYHYDEPHSPETASSRACFSTNSGAWEHLFLWPRLFRAHHIAPGAGRFALRLCLGCAARSALQSPEREQPRLERRWQSHLDVHRHREHEPGWPAQMDGARIDEPNDVLSAG